MTGMRIVLVEWLPAEAPAAVLIGSSLIWLAHRSLSVIELWIILRFLPSVDRVTAAVAYLSRGSARNTRPGEEVERTARYISRRSDNGPS
jgi:hypothetical protein